MFDTVNAMKMHILLVLAVFGLLISLYLTYAYSQPAPVTCFIGEDACEVVRQSPQSYLFGLRLPLIGDMYFMAMIIYLGFFRRWLKYAIVPLACAAIFGLYLIYVQLFVINATCFWCVLIEAVTFLMLLLYTNVFERLKTVLR